MGHSHTEPDTRDLGHKMGHNPPCQTQNHKHRTRKQEKISVTSEQAESIHKMCKKIEKSLQNTCLVKG